jgi:hypothetical protein
MRVRYGLPAPTIRELVRHRLDLSTWCKACDRLGRTLVAEDLAMALGADFCLLQLDPRLRCMRCGRDRVSTGWPSLLHEHGARSDVVFRELSRAGFVTGAQ